MPRKIELQNHQNSINHNEPLSTFVKRGEGKSKSVNASVNAQKERMMKQRQNKLGIWTIAAVLTLFSGEALARSWRVAQVPNGAVFNCQLCHQRPGGGGLLNAFGTDVNDFVTRASRVEFWIAQLAELDSDGDGFTNGQELGDPDGDGIATDGASVTNPSDPNDHPTPPIEQPKPIHITNIRLTVDPNDNRIVTLSWTGGAPPFIIQRTVSINDPSWTIVTAETMPTEPPANEQWIATISLNETTAPIGFFRILHE